jgi:ATP-binding cassette, subfamily F, member 3
VFDTLEKVAVGDIRFKLRDILAAFLFKGEDIDKKVAVLSGGERSRLAMAKLILKPYNLLALDEPTNHMDIRSKDILKQALQKYDGTLVIVSHDRDFLDGLVDKVYEYKDGKVKEYLGGVSEFLESKKLSHLTDLEIKATTSLNQTQEQSLPKREIITKSKLSFEEQKESRKKQKKIEQYEKKIEQLEKQMKDIESQLSNPVAGLDIDGTTRKYLELKRELDLKMEEWSSLED